MIEDMLCATLVSVGYLVNKMSICQKATPNHLSHSGQRHKSFHILLGAPTVPGRSAIYCQTQQLLYHVLLEAPAFMQVHS